MKVILISGKAEHGKTATAEYLQNTLEQEYSKRVLIVGFADKLKFIAAKYFGWNGVKDEKGRELLQYLGTDVVRKKDPDYWVRNVADFVKVFEDSFDYILLHDTRFINEVEYFKNIGMNTLSIRVNRLNFKSNLTPEQLLHPSETALDNYNFDYYINSLSGRSLIYPENDMLYHRLQE